MDATSLGTVRSVMHSPFEEGVNELNSTTRVQSVLCVIIRRCLERSQTSCDLKSSGVRPRTKTLDAMHSDEQYQDMLQEMMRMTQESKEESDEEDTRLRRIVGEDNFEILKGGAARRRGGGHLPSAAARRRRARSQALRRDKLNSQGLRSHLTHVRRLRDSLDTDLSLDI